MPTLRSLLGEDATVAAVAEAIRSAMGVERLSIATFDHEHAAFEIVMSSGKPLFEPGLEVPVETTTQMHFSATGAVYCAGEFCSDARWGRPVDELMLGLGFRSGCSVPLGPALRPVGAVSLSSTRPGLDYERRADALGEVQDLLTRLLPGGARGRAGMALICHDDELVSHGLARLLEREIGLRSVSCTTVAQAVTVLEQHPITLIVCDDFLAGADFGTIAAALRATGSTAAFVVVSSHDTPFNQRAAASGGAAGYVSRVAGGAEILSVLASVTAGRRRPFPCEPGSVPDAERLTRRERDVLLDLDEGLRFKQIALRRRISPATANGYAKSLFRKLGAHSRSEAVKRARESGLLDSVRRRDGAPGVR